jgi:two-component system, cell cycle sensor histidine kinase PleC
VWIAVADTGIGIAPAQIATALAPFGQLESSQAKRHEGTGLGLPLAKRLIELMGGVFTLDSELGKGTSISFSLPRLAAEAAQADNGKRAASA